MGRSFAITSLTNAVELKEDKTGEVTLTVTNKGGRALKGMARIVPIDATRAEWVTICDGEPERAFDKDGTHQYKVRIILPADTPKGTYTFRMDFVSSEDPDGDSTQGPAIAVKLAGDPAPAAPGRFPWWILIVVGAVLLAGGITTWIVLATKGPKMLEVPELVGKPLQEALDLAAAAGFTTQLGEEQNKAGAAPGTVVDQKPPKGEKTEKGAAIEIFVQKPAPPPQELVDVPDVQKRTIEQAKLALFEKGFTPKEGPAQFKGGPPGIVVDQQPAGGVKAPRGSAVTIVPEAESILVPNVRSKPLKDAVLLLQNAKFEVELQTQVKAGAPADVVFDQKPGPGERALAKATVVIFIPQAPPTKIFDHVRLMEGIKMDTTLQKRMMISRPPNSIASVKPDAQSAASLISGQYVTVSFSYTTTHGGKGAIHIQPLTKGAPTPGATVIHLPLSPAGHAEPQDRFTVLAKTATHVDELWFRMYDANKQEVLNQKFPVQLQFWPRK